MIPATKQGSALTCFSKVFSKGLEEKFIPHKILEQIEEKKCHFFENFRTFPLIFSEW